MARLFPIKGIIKIQNACFEMVTLKEKIQERLLKINLLFKMLHHLTSLMHELEFRHLSLNRLGLEDIHVRKDYDFPDVFIAQEIVIEYNKETPFKFLINIFKILGINPVDIKKIKNVQDCYIYLQSKLQIQPYEQRQMLSNIYGLDVKKDIFIKVFSVVKPYYLKSDLEHAEEIAVKIIKSSDDIEARKEVENLIGLRKIQTQDGQSSCFSSLFCYCALPDNQILLFLQLCDCDLDDFIQLNKEKLSAKTKMIICRKIIESLIKVHHKVIHRDIKPKNIMIKKINDQGGYEEENLQCVIIDFDHSTLKGKVDEQTYTGTQGYVPPEKILDQQFTEKYDIWQLGLTFLYLVNEEEERKYGKQKYRPYPLEEYNQIIQKSLEKTQLKSPSLYVLLKKMLNYNPDERPTLEYVSEELGKQLHS